MLHSLMLHFPDQLAQKCATKHLPFKHIKRSKADQPLLYKMEFII